MCPRAFVFIQNIKQDIHASYFYHILYVDVHVLKGSTLSSLNSPLYSVIQVLKAFSVLRMKTERDSN